jgi:hypothetical protein
VTRTDPHHYFLFMLSTVLVLGGVLVGLLVLLALIVSLSARPATVARSTGTGRGEAWVAQAARPHPDAWAPMAGASTSELPAVR